jgi:hypothetical protein
VPKLAMMSLVSSHGPVAQPHLLVMCSPLMLPSVGATSHDKDSNISFEFLFIMTCHQKYQYRHGLVIGDGDEGKNVKPKKSRSLEWIFVFLE